MTYDHHTPRSGGDGAGPDAELSRALRALDPGEADPTYWFRFRDRVLKRAQAELARRRLMAQLTVSEVMSSWARTVLPVALAAAALATVMLTSERRANEPQIVSVEELLLTGSEGESAAELLRASPEEGGSVTFASEIF